MRLAMIGCGEHATAQHGPVQALYAARHPGTVLAACCDRDAVRAERFRECFSHARAYTETAAMLEAERPDAVMIAVPVAHTAKVAEEVLRRGVPALIEKPPGLTVEEVDRLVAAAESGRPAPVPHQAAFNRRFAPVMREAHDRLAVRGGAAAVQHVHYEMTRVDRRERDFSTTAIHGLDAVRFLARADYAEARFRYREYPALGPGVADIFVDAVMASGATAHLAFCPVAGVAVERATVHGHGHTLYVHVPIWAGLDSPGRLLHLERDRVVADVTGDPAAETFVLAGFYGEYEAFLADLAAGRTPSPSLRESRQSVAMAEHIRHRAGEFKA